MDKFIVMTINTNYICRGECHKLKLKENANNVDEFNLLYDLVDWGSYDKEISQKALNNTYYSVSIYEDEQIINYNFTT